VTSGDEVTIDWKAEQITSTEMDIYPNGTTDYTYPNVEDLLSSDFNSNGKNQATLTATSDGVLPVEFRVITCGGDTPVPYDFTASVTHQMVLSLLGLGAALSGTAQVGVHNPDGVALSGAPLQVALQVSKTGVLWTTIGTSTPVNGVASVTYAIPASLAGSKVKIRAVGTGSGYAEARTSTQTIALPAAATCKVPDVIGLELKAASKALTGAHCAVGTLRCRRTKRARRGRVIAQGDIAGSSLEMARTGPDPW
jgi:hypothetical protein